MQSPINTCKEYSVFAMGKIKFSLWIFFFLAGSYLFATGARITCIEVNFCAGYLIGAGDG